MKLNILTFDKEMLNVSTDKVTLPGKEGEFTVLPSHAKLIARLKKGEIVYVQGGDRRIFNLESGAMAEVKDDMITVLIS